MPYIQLQFRRDTTQNWHQTNPLLASGEMGIELDTHTFKIGDGTRRWNQLPYGGLQGPPGPAGGAPVTPGIPGQVLTCTGPSPSDVVWMDPLVGTRNCAIIRVLQNGTNFDFTNANVEISPRFGTGIAPTFGYSGIGTDSTGFSLRLNSQYNLVRLPFLVGTIAYWDQSCNKLTYVQIKFGNSSTNNAVRARITPTQGYLTAINSNNIRTYGSPLTLEVDGISSTAFSGADNISSAAPLNYALTVFIQILN